MPSLAKAIWGLVASTALQLTQQPLTLPAFPPSHDVLAAAQQALFPQPAGQPAIAQAVAPASNAPATILDGGGRAWAWRNCGSQDDIVDVHSIVVSPDPPQRGKNMTVRATGTVRQRIEEGAYAMVDVKLGLIRLLHRQVDICEEARDNKAEVQCPIESNDYDISQTVQLPSQIPPAKFGVHMEAFSANDDPLLCLDLTVDFLQR